MILASVIYTILLGVLIALTYQNVGIEIYIGAWFVGLTIFAFGVVGWLYERQVTYTLFGRDFTKYWTIISMIGILTVSAVFIGVIQFTAFKGQQKPIVGTHYNYFMDDGSDIFDELERMLSAGITAVKIDYIENIVYPEKSVDSNLDYDQTLEVMQSAEELGIEMCVRTKNYDSEIFAQYVNHFGRYVDVWQVANEVDQIHYDVDGGSYYLMRSEVEARLTELIDTIKSYDTEYVLITTFTMGFPARADWMIPVPPYTSSFGKISSYVSAVGISFYQEEGEFLRPYEVNYMRTLSEKEVWIMEVGSPSSNDEYQSAYIMRCLRFAETNGVPRVYLWGWNVGDYEICGRQAENDIKEWLSSGFG